VVAPPAAASAPAAASTSSQAAPVFDEARAAELKTRADRNPNDAETRVQLGNLYFDAERYDEATRWYEQAIKVDPKNVNASTDLGIAYYYSIARWRSSIDRWRSIRSMRRRS
jgi:cytochrome c-type biogenesis protein CcmH/NrfG